LGRHVGINVCVCGKTWFSQWPKADGLRKKLQTSVSDDPCTRERRADGS
jgi:hypothetical protein